MADETPFLALITMTSVGRLEVEPGTEVVASFKATTRAVPTGTGDGS